MDPQEKKEPVQWKYMDSSQKKEYKKIKQQEIR
jgi:hypothetical protein